MTSLGGEEISNLSDYITEVKRIIQLWRTMDDYQNNCCWFRGLRKDSYDLIPSLIRPFIETEKYNKKKIVEIEKDIHEDEFKLYDMFKHKSLPFLKHSSYPLSNIDYMILMQHYQIPTRLLDWTSNAITALFFAVEPKRGGQEEDKANAEVILMDPYQFNGITQTKSSLQQLDKDEEDKFFQSYETLPDNPWAFVPKQNNPRIIAQQGYFTVHGKYINPIDSWFTTNQRIDSIKIANKEEIYSELKRIGIRRLNLFPELESLHYDILEDIQFGN